MPLREVKDVCSVVALFSFSLVLACLSGMPRSKQALLRRKKLRPPPRNAVESTPVSGETATERSKTASEKKLGLFIPNLFRERPIEKD